MPELPEVETTRRLLEQPILGATIERVEIRRDRMARRNERPADVVDRLVGRTVETVRRKGKFMLFDVSGDIVWVTHLGMSGRISLVEASEPEAPHTNVVVGLSTPIEFRMVDPRTFGFVAAWTEQELETSSVGMLGPDALDDLPSADDLAGSLEGRSAPIKALLLDQRLIAGLGNIYADEVLWRAEVAPHRPGSSLESAEVAGIRRAIPLVLEEGLRHGGTSLGDLAYLLPDGRAGEYMGRLRAYGREDEGCHRCGGIVERSVIRQRSSFWCRGCQR